MVPRCVRRGLCAQPGDTGQWLVRGAESWGRDQVEGVCVVLGGRALGWGVCVEGAGVVRGAGRQSAEGLAWR